MILNSKFELLLQLYGYHFKWILKCCLYSFKLQWWPIIPFGDSCHSIFCSLHLDKYLLKFGQIHLTIWTNREIRIPNLKQSYWYLLSFGGCRRFSQCKYGKLEAGLFHPDLSFLSGALFRSVLQTMSLICRTWKLWSQI